MRAGISNPYAGLGQGAASLGEAAINAAGTRERARNDRETQLLKNNLYAHQGNKLGAETDALRDKASATASLAAPGGVDTLFANNPQLQGLAGQFLRSGESVQDLQNLGLQREATALRRDGGDASLANALLEATRGNAYTPFAVQGGGVLDTGTGGFDITPVGESDVYRNRAAGAASYGTANAANALAEQRRAPASSEPQGPSFTDVSKLRAEFNKQSANYVKSRDSYNRLAASARDPSAAGDLALIFNYMKILDPGSTVREGEFATAQNAGGVDDRVRSLFNSIVNGQRLTIPQRTDFVNRAGMLFDEQDRAHNELRRQYEGIAQRANIPLEDALVDYRLERADAGGGEGTGGAVPAAPPTDVKLLPGVQEIIDKFRLEQ